MLGQNSYGKSGIRLVHVDRRAGRHAVSDLTVAVRLEGDFEAAHVSGDNAGLARQPRPAGRRRGSSR